MTVSPRLTTRTEDGREWPALVWAPGPGWRMAASAVTGGGIGPRAWWFNTQVNREYFEPDPQAHIARIAACLGLTGDGVGMLTAADVGRVTTACEAGVEAVATVGLGLPVWAAAPDAAVLIEPVPRVGTINVLVICPVPLSDAALINAVGTLTEAKTQALIEAGIAGTGTSSDAVCIACPGPGLDSETGTGAGPGAGSGSGAEEPYAGPRSEWGARIARTVHTAVTAGTHDWLATFGTPGREQLPPIR